MFLSALLASHFTLAFGSMVFRPSTIKAHSFPREHSLPLVHRGHARAIPRDVIGVITVNTKALVSIFCMVQGRFFLRALGERRLVCDVIFFSRWVYISPFLQGLGQTR